MNILKKSNEKLSNPSFILKAIFWALVVLVLLIISVTVGIITLTPAFRRYNYFIAIFKTIYFFAFSSFRIPLGKPYCYTNVFEIICLLLGITLIFFTIREKIKGLLKKFLILTGASAVGFFISIFLHNLTYGLFIEWFGADFWERTGIGDEPFFFILATIICPIAFLVGVIGSIILFIKKKKRKIS